MYAYAIDGLDVEQQHRREAREQLDGILNAGENGVISTANDDKAKARRERAAVAAALGQ